MSLHYQTIVSKPKLFRQLTTLTLAEFDLLVKKLEPEWKEREILRLSRPDRKRAIGQGHPYFGTFSDLILFLTIYTRTNCSNVLLGLVFGLTEPTIIDLSKKLLPLLQDRFVPKTRLRKKRATINTLDELLKVYPDLEDVILDGCAIKTRRPKRKQGKNYSGKSKRHEKKIVLGINRKDGIIIGRTKLRPGAVHDKRILDEDGLHKRLEKDHKLKKRTDSAWTGEDKKKGWIVNRKGRRNHPLTKKQKKENRKLSKIRIGIEHAIRRVKVFRRIGETAVFRAKGKLDSVLNAAINLANYKQLIRYPAKT
jgi:DDE superfamily endonuclease